jgi:hypothetical protein
MAGMADQKPDEESEEREPALPCSEKLSFKSRQEAVATRAYAGWQYGDGRNLEPYQCDKCGDWHLASKNSD